MLTIKKVILFIAIVVPVSIACMHLQDSIPQPIGDLIAQQYCDNKQVWYLSEKLCFSEPFDDMHKINAIHPNKDTARVLVASDDGTINIWESEGFYEKVCSVPQCRYEDNHYGPPCVSHTYLYNNEKQLLTVSRAALHPGVVIVWDIAYKSSKKKSLSQEIIPFNVNDEELISCDSMYDAHVKKTFIHDNEIVAFCVSGDESTAITSTIKADLRVWDMATLAERGFTFLNFTCLVSRPIVRWMCSNYDATRIAIGLVRYNNHYNEDDCVCVYDGKKMRYVTRFGVSTSFGVCNKVGSLIFAINQLHLYVLDVNTRKIIEFAVKNYNNIFAYITLNHNEEQLILVSIDGTIRIWDARTYAQLSMIRSHGELITAAYLYKNDDLLARTCNSLALWKKLGQLTIDQIWFLYALHTSLLVRKVPIILTNCAQLLDYVANTLQYNKEDLIKVSTKMPPSFLLYICGQMNRTKTE